jgi:hypothetical protein
MWPREEAARTETAAQTAAAVRRRPEISRQPLAARHRAATYPNLQTACLAGVRTVGGDKCGTTINLGHGGTSAGVTRTLCGQDSQCPSGERCCHLTGFCFDDAHAALCAMPPEGTNYPCITNEDCLPGDFCDAPSCDGPGGCKPIGFCDALLEPVCGCDGKTYVNPPCAASKGVRVASEGECVNTR